jgi:hypothetical protein
VALRGLGETTGGMAAPVDPRRRPGLCECRVDGPLPQIPDALASSLLGQQRHPLSGLGIAVPDDQVRMRVEGVPPGLVQRRQPRRPASRQSLGEAPHELGPPPPVEFARQGQHDLVDHPRVLAVVPLLPVQPSPRRLALERHPGADHLRPRLAGRVM